MESLPLLFPWFWLCRAPTDGDATLWALVQHLLWASLLYLGPVFLLILGLTALLAGLSRLQLGQGGPLLLAAAVTARALEGAGSWLVSAAAVAGSAAVLLLVDRRPHLPPWPVPPWPVPPWPERAGRALILALTALLALQELTSLISGRGLFLIDQAVRPPVVAWVAGPGLLAALAALAGLSLAGWAWLTLTPAGRRWGGEPAPGLTAGAFALGALLVLGGVVPVAAQSLVMPTSAGELVLAAAAALSLQHLGRWWGVAGRAALLTGAWALLTLAAPAWTTVIMVTALTLAEQTPPFRLLPAFPSLHKEPRP